MTKDLAKKEETALSNQVSGLGIEGVEGFDMSDLPMPFVKLVHGTSKNTDLLNGGKAPVGSYYHTSKKEAKEDMGIVILYSKKGEIEDYNDPTVTKKSVKILAVDIDDLDSPFVLQLSGGGYWAFSKLLGAFKSWKITKPWSRIVVMSSKEVTSKDGRNEFLVPVMELSEELTKEDMVKVEKLRSSFQNFSGVDEAEDTTEEHAGEQVNVDDIDFGDLGLDDPQPKAKK